MAETSNPARGARPSEASSGSLSGESPNRSCPISSDVLRALASTQISNNPPHPPSGGSETSLRVFGEGSIGIADPHASESNPSPKPRSSALTLPREGKERCVDTTASWPAQPRRYRLQRISLWRSNPCDFAGKISAEIGHDGIKLAVETSIRAARPSDVAIPREPPMPDPPAPIAHIRPVGRRQSGNLLSLASLLVSSALLIAFQAGWVLAMFAGLLMLSINATAAAVMLLISLAWLCLQFALVFMYPEWPLNRLLTHRLCRSVETRLNPLVSPAEEGVRVVELVPRPRWQKLALETATDLMLIRVDDQGVWMTGDRCEYSLGRDSILGAELHSVTPSGWFTATHMVIVYVRTDEGQIELPLAYRDHGFGSLRSSRQRAEAADLLSRILRVARGHLYQPPIEPPRSEIARAPRWSANPFQSPTII